MVESIDSSENVFSMDSKPVEVCRLSCGTRNRVGATDYKKAPSMGFCASQNRYYYSYKLHAVYGVRGAIHSFYLTKASLCDIHYLRYLEWEFLDCTLLGDKAYLGEEIQLDLFETVHIPALKSLIEVIKETLNRHSILLNDSGRR